MGLGCGDAIQAAMTMLFTLWLQVGLDHNALSEEEEQMLPHHVIMKQVRVGDCGAGEGMELIR